ncbi:MAG TPA: hypothetical protein PL016_05020, partial [Kiritimatiellia bacterium]|nr:hypothetical protein [Kiritimatiellia bacterium]
MRQFLCMLAGLMVVAGCAQKMWGQHGALAAPQALTVDYLQDPVGLDHAAPRLSWKLIAARRSARDLRQVAYQILVASSPERLRDNQGDLWDSGRVVSDQSLNVVYVGKPLVTSQRCYWKVRVWDNQSDAPTAWSATGRWIMGVMRPNDWQARWIGANAATRPDCDLAGAQWIWTGDAPSLEQAAQGVRYFRRVFDAPRGAQDAPVLLALTADDEYEVFINGKRAAKTWGHFNESRWMRFQDVSALIKPGRNLIAATVKNKAPGPTALLAVLKFADGQAVPTDTTWSSSAQAVDGWKEKADGFAHDAWKAAV